MDYKNEYNEKDYKNRHNKGKNRFFKYTNPNTAELSIDRLLRKKMFNVTRILLKEYNQEIKDNRALFIHEFHSIKLLPTPIKIPRHYFKALDQYQEAFKIWNKLTQNTRKKNKFKKNAIPYNIINEMNIASLYLVLLLVNRKHPKKTYQKLLNCISDFHENSPFKYQLLDNLNKYVAKNFPELILDDDEVLMVKLNK